MPSARCGPAWASAGVLVCFGCNLVLIGVAQIGRETLTHTHWRNHYSAATWLLRDPLRFRSASESDSSPLRGTVARHCSHFALVRTESTECTPHTTRERDFDVGLGAQAKLAPFTSWSPRLMHSPDGWRAPGLRQGLCHFPRRRGAALTLMVRRLDVGIPHALVERGAERAGGAGEGARPMARRNPHCGLRRARASRRCDG